MVSSGEDAEGNALSSECFAKEQVALVYFKNCRKRRREKLDSRGEKDKLDLSFGGSSRREEAS